MSHPKDATQDTTDTGQRNVREFNAVCFPPKTNEDEWNSSVGNATQGCVFFLNNQTSNFILL